MLHSGFCTVNENASVNHKVRREIKKSKLLYYEIKDNATILLTYYISSVTWKTYTKIENDKPFCKICSKQPCTQLVLLLFHFCYRYSRSSINKQIQK